MRDPVTIRYTEKKTASVDLLPSHAYTQAHALVYEATKHMNADIQEKTTTTIFGVLLLPFLLERYGVDLPSVNRHQGPDCLLE